MRFTYTLGVSLLYLLSVNADTTANTDFNFFQNDTKGLFPEYLDKPTHNKFTVGSDYFKQYIGEIFSGPWEKIEVIEDRIQELRKNNEVCVDATNLNVTTTMVDMDKSTEKCIATASKSVEKIHYDIQDAIQELTTYGYAFLSYRRKCNQLDTAESKTYCLTQFPSLGKVYIKNARKSLKNIGQIINKRVPAAKTKVGNCTRGAADVAEAQLKSIHGSIVKCIGEN